MGHGKRNKEVQGLIQPFLKILETDKMVNA